VTDSVWRPTKIAPDPKPFRAGVRGHVPEVLQAYPIPENLHHNPLVNEVMRRRYQFRWERAEYEARKIERGTWTEPEVVPFVPRDDWGNRIEKIDLHALAREKAARARENTPENTREYPENTPRTLTHL